MHQKLLYVYHFPSVLGHKFVNGIVGRRRVGCAAARGFGRVNLVGDALSPPPPLVTDQKTRTSVLRISDTSHQIRYSSRSCFVCFGIPCPHFLLFCTSKTLSFSLYTTFGISVFWITPFFPCPHLTIPLPNQIQRTDDEFFDWIFDRDSRICVSSPDRTFFTAILRGIFFFFFINQFEIVPCILRPFHNLKRK